MKNLFKIITILLLWTACQSDKSLEKIQQLEQELAATNSPDVAKTLVQEYINQVKNHPERKEANLQFLLKAADIQYFKTQDAIFAARALHDALTRFGEGQNLSPLFRMSALIWNDNLYRASPANKMRPEDIDTMRMDLSKNTLWLDSVLVNLDKKIQQSFTTGLDKTVCNEFIDISESYASVVENSAPDKYFDLIYRAAALAKTAEMHTKAIAFYEKLLLEKPEAPRAGQAAFMIGFIYENDLKDLAKAKTAYQLVLDKYSSDKDMAANAQLALKNLGKSPDEILKAAGVK